MKNRNLFTTVFALERVKSFQNESNRKNAAHTLTDEGCPRNTRNTHAETVYKQNIHADICR